MKVKIGLQTITWGDPQKKIMGEILGTASDIGYDGVELGWRHLATFAPADIGTLLSQYGMTLLGSHAGGNLEDAEQAGSEQRQIDVILNSVKAQGGELLMYSGLRYENDRKLARDVDSLNTIARLCHDQGVQLLYHNHDWEFADDGRVFDALLNQTVPELGFCPDVGWLYKTDHDPLVLEAMKDRIGAVHFKDFHTGERGTLNTCCLGDGRAPLREAAQWVKKLERESLWVIAEQDKSDEPAQEAAKKNFAFLSDCFGSLS